ncbi:hypothetical protein DPMN_108215 [Dreissena polymorpha]|uniref:Uncharacterized protein n=1 Tax=Dreissena polymorpha TaxID=45954 RepID=A0A9D4K8N3_DREPO|nr:hypothetical protein DPMN_108215 [Dreissena polymorpha]
MAHHKRPWLLNRTIFFLIQDIMRKKILTKFQEDWTINVISIVLTRENALHHGRQAFQPSGTIYELVLDIIGINLLIKFYTAQKINVASRMLKRYYCSHIMKNAPHHGYHVLNM